MNAPCRVVGAARVGVPPLAGSLLLTACLVLPACEPSPHLATRPKLEAVAGHVSLATLVPRLASDTVEVHPPATIEPVDLEVPDRCDRLLRRETASGPQLGKQRPAWLRKADTRWAHQQRLRALIGVVARELGADETAAEMIWRKAIYESSGNAGNVHIRSRDIEANRAAASKGRQRAAPRWRRAKVPVYDKRRGKLREVGSFDAWALGRGLYGMVTGLHVHRWSSDAPPWSLCDPIIATVTLIWAMRAGLAECRGTTLRDAYRRFSSGKCARREESLERRFDHLARGKVRGLSLDAFDPDAPAVLGERWPEATTDRGTLLAILRDEVAAAGLEQPPP